MKCINCNKELEDNLNNTKKYCSDKCRKSYSRRTTKSDNVRDETKSDIKSDNSHKCLYCEHIITDEYYGGRADLIDVCYCCVAKRNELPRETYPKCCNEQ